MRWPSAAESLAMCRGASMSRGTGTDAVSGFTIESWKVSFFLRASMVKSDSMSLVSSRIGGLQQSLRPLLEFLNTSAHARRNGDATISDFVFGNPHEMPLEGLVDAIRRHAVPENKNWF